MVYGLGKSLESLREVKRGFDDELKVLLKRAYELKQETRNLIMDLEANFDALVINYMMARRIDSRIEYVIMERSKIIKKIRKREEYERE